LYDFVDDVVVVDDDDNDDVDDVDDDVLQVLFKLQLLSLLLSLFILLIAIITIINNNIIDLCNIIFLSLYNYNDELRNLCHVCSLV